MDRGASADINLYLEGYERAVIVVQCKPWSAYRVGIKPVRELRGAMASSKIGEGVLVSAGKFKQEALALLKLATQDEFATPTCPAWRYWGCRNPPASRPSSTPFSSRKKEAARRRLPK